MKQTVKMETTRLILAVFGLVVLTSMVNTACTGGGDTGVSYGPADAYGADQNFADDTSH